MIAEYALRGYSTPIGVADWATPITTSLPDDLAGALPSIEQLEPNCPTIPTRAA